MQIQTAVRQQSPTVSQTTAHSSAGLATITNLSDLTWATVAHRRRLAKMNRSLLLHLMDRQLESDRQGR